MKNMFAIKHRIAKILWYFFKDKVIIESGKHLASNEPWFRIQIFGEKITTIDYTGFEIMKMRN